jgi:hypothetical protein
MPPIRQAWPVLLLPLALAGCPGSGGSPLAGDSICVGFSEAGAPQATVSGSGITIVIPLIMKKDAGAD